MKTPLTLVLAALLWASPKSGHTQAYKSEKLTYLDANGNSVKKRQAVAVQQVIQLSDSLWEINSYKMYGPRTLSARYSDPDGRIPNGTYITYYPTGLCDTIGEYNHGIRTGIWYFNAPSGRTAGTQFYGNGQLSWAKGTLQMQQEQDSSWTASKKDTSQAFSKEEVESAIPGGATARLQYLNRNLQYPDDEFKHMVQGKSVIGFIVDKQGNIEPNSVWVEKSVDLGIDKESIRVILLSGQWTPAVQNQRLVRSYKKQPFIFYLKAK